MNANTKEIRDLLENYPLYKQVSNSSATNLFDPTTVSLREISSFCENCDEIKPFHNFNDSHQVYTVPPATLKKMDTVQFNCVTCQKTSRIFHLWIERRDNLSFLVSKIGEFPQKQLPKNKSLSKFFREDKAEYNKAVICIANGYGVAAFAYMRRIVEKNILSLLDQIQESVSQDSAISNSINELKATSPMSDRIRIANSALPDYLKPDGFNPLGQIYGLLSDGVHSLSDSECLDKAENIQACLEFLISELAAHKQNKEEFKKRLDALRK